MERGDTVTVIHDDAPTIDRDMLVTDLRRQVADADPGDDNRPWRQVFIDLANDLAATTWCAPGTDPLATAQETRVVTRTSP